MMCMTIYIYIYAHTLREDWEGGKDCCVYDVDDDARPGRGPGRRQPRFEQHSSKHSHKSVDRALDDTIVL